MPDPLPADSQTYPAARRGVKAQTLPTAAFPLPLHLERTGPGLAILRAPFAFYSPLLGYILVEAGFDTDYASVPRLFWSFYPPDGSYTPAAIIHDALYFYQTAGTPSEYHPLAAPLRISRAQADHVFLEAMTALGVPPLRRRLLHLAVRAGGWLAWKRNAKWHAAEAARAAAEEASAKSFVE